MKEKGGGKITIRGELGGRHRDLFRKRQKTRFEEKKKEQHGKRKKAA